MSRDKISRHDRVAQQERVMTVQDLYLIMVIAAFSTFAVVLFTVSLWSQAK